MDLRCAIYPPKAYAVQWTFLRTKKRNLYKYLQFQAIQESKNEDEGWFYRAFWSQIWKKDKIKNSGSRVDSKEEAEMPVLQQINSKESFCRDMGMQEMRE